MSKIGKFIVFEGLDGCGTTTQLQLLSENLNSKQIRFLSTYEPTNNIIGGLIKGALKKQWKITAAGLQLLFCADRAHHLDAEILPALKKGKHVICDRYIFSTIAFGSLECDSWWLTQLNKDFPAPDLVLYLKVPPKVCVERIKKRGFENELFEEENKLQKIEEIYDFLAKKHKNMVTIDGHKAKSIVAETIWNEVQKLI